MDQRFEGGPVDVLAIVDVDRAAHGAVETGVEETGRILERRAFSPSYSSGVVFEAGERGVKV